MGHRGVADLFASSKAVLVFDDGEEVSAPAMVDRARLELASLRAQGFKPRDRVAMHRGNDQSAVELLLAAALGGLTVVAVNTRYSDAEVADLVSRSGARLPAQHTAVGPASDDPSIDRNDEPFIVFTTSGTTSKPKMVLHHQRSIVEHAVDVVERFEYSSADTVLMDLPICGTFGLTSLMAAVAGNARVLVHGFDLAATTALTHRERVTTMNGSDDMLHRLLNAGADLSHIRLAGYAQFNAALGDIAQRGANHGAVFTGLYGMSEVQALFALRDPSLDVDGRERAGGTVVSSRAAARVVDGELQLRGPSLFAGYLHEGGDAIDEELTGRHFVTDENGDAWFRTGDLAAMDDDRTFHYISRLGDVLRLGGFLVSPTEITDVLMAAPGVTGAQVVAVDRESGARPVAFVTRDSETALDENALIDHCRERLARYKVPIRIVEVDGFPVTDGPNGVKVRLTELRDRARDLLSESST